MDDETGREQVQVDDQRYALVIGDDYVELLVNALRFLVDNPDWIPAGGVTVTPPPHQYIQAFFLPLSPVSPAEVLAQMKPLVYQPTVQPEGGSGKIAQAILGRLRGDEGDDATE